MSEASDIKATAAAEKAYAAAAAEAEAKTKPEAVKPVSAPVEAPTPAQKKAPATKLAGAAPKPKTPATKPVKAAKPGPKRALPGIITNPAKPDARLAATDHTIAELKEKIMATAQKTTPDYSKLIKDVQGKAQAAYAKGSAVVGDVSTFSKGNVEAVVASGKILATGAKALGKDYVTETKSAIGTLTADMKELAAVQSPTELFQLQGKLARRNFDSAVAFGSKTSETLLKLANEAFAPISNRVSVAVDKVSRAA